jgi:hypothetical protein
MLGWTIGKTGGLGPCCPPRTYNTWLVLRFLMLGATRYHVFERLEGAEEPHQV